MALGHLKEGELWRGNEAVAAKPPERVGGKLGLADVHGDVVEAVLHRVLLHK